MRKFKFIGDSSTWGWEVNPITNKVYNLEDLPSMYGKEDWKSSGGIYSIILTRMDVWVEIVDSEGYIKELVVSYNKLSNESKEQFKKLINV